MAGGCAGIAHRKKEIAYIMIEAICTKTTFAQKGKELIPHFTVGNIYIATVTPSGNKQIENDRDQTLVFNQDRFKEHFLEVH